MTNHPYANYSFSFKTSLAELQYSQIIIKFPLVFNFNNSYVRPYLSNIPYCGLKNISQSQTISY